MIVAPIIQIAHIVILLIWFLTSKEQAGFTFSTYANYIRCWFCMQHLFSFVLTIFLFMSAFLTNSPPFIWVYKIFSPFIGAFSSSIQIFASSSVSRKFATSKILFFIFAIIWLMNGEIWLKWSFNYIFIAMWQSLLVGYKWPQQHLNCYDFQIHSFFYNNYHWSNFSIKLIKILSIILHYSIISLRDFIWFTK